MTRALMVGAGNVAQRHIRVLTGLGAKVVGVVDVHEPAARALAEEWSTTAYGDIEQALDESAPEVVYVCVPPFAHGAPEMAVLERSLPLFVEKPLAVSTEVAEEVALRVEETGVVTGTGYHWRCLDIVDRARELLASGPALMVEGHWLGKRPPVAWWADVDKSGGQVVEQLTHLLDVARALVGEPVEVHALGTTAPGRDPSAGTVDDATAAAVRFEGGAVATFSATSILAAQHRAGLDLLRPGSVLRLTETELVVDDGEAPTAHQRAEDPRKVVDREFLEAVRGEKASTRAPYAEALRTHRFGCAIAASAREGRPLTLDATTGCWS
jgi:predicted dehydrogenase